VIVYRGPSSKDFLDESHELVASVDLSSDMEPWTSSKTVRVNVSKDAHQRFSVVTIIINDTDILALNQGLVKGLQREANEGGAAKKTVAKLQAALKDIAEWALLADVDEAGVIPKIQACAEAALEAKAD
jgi:hypothetical protein